MKIKAQGVFNITIRRRDGEVKKYKFYNGVTVVGINDLLDAGFSAGTQRTSWYFGLIDNSGFSTLSENDTMSSHAGWSESTAYSDATRRIWNAGTPSSKKITTTVASTFNINASATLRGLFLCSDNTKGGTSGILWATGLFDSVETVGNGDSVDVEYELEITNS